MLARLRPRSAYDVMAALALVLVVTGGSALAAHETIFSDDIVDGEVKNPDLGADSVSTSKIQTQGVTTGDLAPNSVSSSRIPDEAVGTSEIAQGSVFNADLAPNSITETRIVADAVGSSELQDNSVGAEEAKPDSLTGNEVQESSLQVPLGKGSLTGNATALGQGTSNSVVLEDRFGGDQHFILGYSCPSTPAANNGSAIFVNRRELSVHVFIDDGDSTHYELLPPAGGAIVQTEKPAAPTDLITFQARWDDNRVMTGSMAVRHRASDCHLQAQGLVSYDTVVP